MEDAYPQEKGECGVSFSTQYMGGKKSKEVEYEAGEREDELELKDEWRWITELEYGILDWLEFKAEIPFLNVNKSTI